MLYLTVIGSLLAFTAYGWLLRVAPLPLIATYAYVNPIVAVILGAIVLSEPIEPRTLVAGAVIVVGVAVIVSARGRMAGPRSQPAADVRDGHALANDRRLARGPRRILNDLDRADRASPVANRGWSGCSRVENRVEWARRGSTPLRCAVAPA